MFLINYNIVFVNILVKLFTINSCFFCHQYSPKAFFDIICKLRAPKTALILIHVNDGDKTPVQHSAIHISQNKT